MPTPFLFRSAVHDEVRSSHCTKVEASPTTRNDRNKGGKAWSITILWRCFRPEFRPTAVSWDPAGTAPALKVPCSYKVWIWGWTIVVGIPGYISGRTTTSPSCYDQALLTGLGLSTRRRVSCIWAESLLTSAQVYTLRQIRTKALIVVLFPSRGAHLISVHTGFNGAHVTGVLPPRPHPLNQSVKQTVRNIYGEKPLYVGNARRPKLVVKDIRCIFILPVYSFIASSTSLLPTFSYTLATPDVHLPVRSFAFRSLGRPTF